MKIKRFIAALISTTAINASAIVIDARDLAVGTNISDLDPNAHISVLTTGSEFGEPTQFQDAVISQHALRSDRHSIGTPTNAATQWGLRYGIQNPGTTLDEKIAYASNLPYTIMLLISYVKPTRHISFEAVDWYGDGVRVIAFDTDGNWLSNGYGNNRSLQVERSFDSYREIDIYRSSITFSKDVGFILLGGADSSTYITKINTSLPEPETLLLMAMGLLGLAVKFRSTTSKA